MTIQAKELRIGNTIQWLHEEHETFHNVDIEIISVIERYNKTPNDDIFSRGFWFAPIPLTPEVLLKCGFERSIQDGMETYSNTISKEHSYLDWHDDGSVLFRNDRDLVDCSAGIKYLHQLQNLYFALTGTELNYQP